jgi:hypothetical protein
MYDDAVLLPVAAADPNAKVIPATESFLESPYGIGMREGWKEMKAWVDSRLALMAKKDLFLPILKSYVPARFVNGFTKNILRPGNTFGYPPPGTPSADTVCP